MTLQSIDRLARSARLCKASVAAVVANISRLHALEMKPEDSQLLDYLALQPIERVSAVTHFVVYTRSEQPEGSPNTF